MKNNLGILDKEKQVQSPIKLFCADKTPLQAGNFIFDKTYKNMNEKRRFERDPKFAYFNTLTKLKNNFRQSNKDVYGFLFNPKTDTDEKSQHNFPNQQQSPARRPIFTRELAPRQTFHVQKINSHAFKIYKDRNKKVSRSTTYSAITNSQSISDINFHIHYKNRNKQKDQKPKIEILLNQYRKIQMMKSRGNPEKHKQAVLMNGSSLMKSTVRSQRGDTMPHRKINSFMATSRMTVGKAGKAGKRGSNMSQLALNISN